MACTWGPDRAGLLAYLLSGLRLEPWGRTEVIARRTDGTGPAALLRWAADGTCTTYRWRDGQTGEMMPLLALWVAPPPRLQGEDAVQAERYAREAALQPEYIAFHRQEGQE